MVKLDLQYNELSVISSCVLELRSLVDLNLSNNKLVSLPELSEWSSQLTVLDLSHNRLTTIPGEPLAPSIRTLNLADNDFRTVPQCVCHFITLRSLDLSDNKNILSLPPQMGKLRKLESMNLKGLKNLNDPPKSFHSNPADCITYLRGKLFRSKGYYQMKLMLVGKQNRGKTTLVARLQGKDYGSESTAGVDIIEWECKPSLSKRPFYFSIWDFGGQEEYYATHQCFLSERSLYLLLFNLKDGDAGVKELSPWLSNIALRAPMSCVLIVGTHLDEIQPHEREAKVDAVLQKVGDLAGAFLNKLQIKQVLAVGLGRELQEGVGVLKDAIYQCAAEYKVRSHVNSEPVMGQKIPASYHILDKHIQDLQKEVRNGTREPIMHSEEYKSLIRLLELSDLQEDDELKTATCFLHNVGTLLHYDDRSHNLDELYFIDPRWLCHLMAKIVTVKEQNPFIVDGILPTNSIPFLFRDERFPWKFFEQYLTLLDRFEIALALDNHRILVPSMLSDVRPDGIDVTEMNGEPLYIRHVFFTSSTTHPGFWSRLISSIMHSIPQVWYILSAASDVESTGARSTESLGKGSRHSAAVQSSSNSMTSEMKQMEGTVFQLDEDCFRAACATALPSNFDPSEARVTYWRTGMFYQDHDVIFRVESLSGAMRGRGLKEGVVIAVSPSTVGRRIVGVLIDLVTNLVNYWYPGKQSERGPLAQVVLCPECLRTNCPVPYEFDVQNCLTSVYKKETTIQCCVAGDNSPKNHTVSLASVVPDILLQDINAEFLLDYRELDYVEEVNSVLGVGGFGKVYCGRCRGRSVAIKKYLDGGYALSALRNVAMLLQQSHHPCVVCLVGVCVQPSMALVLEEAPMGSLERPLIKQRLAIHRVVIHRIVAQVAAALKYLHNSGVIFRDLKAANVLLWSLDPESLCHCKVTDFETAVYSAPIGARGLIGTKGFMAPEILHFGKNRERSVYDHKADVFSFGMLLYQMITRHHPFHDMQGLKIDSAIENGERPKLQEFPQAENAYFYLTRLMQRCWQGDPRQRPTTSDIIDKVSLLSFQSVMAVQPVTSKLSLRHACTITSTHLSEVNISRENELWVCCDGAEGTEISIYTTNTMTKVNKNFIKDNQVQCISLCGDHVWVASRAGIGYGAIDIFNVKTRDLVHNIKLKDYSVSCITHSDKMVYCGTLEGYCFSFSTDIEQIQSNAKPCFMYVSENAVDGIVVTKDSLWLSHTHYIFFLNLETLATEEGKSQATNVGQFKLSDDGAVVWSAQLGGTSVSAWNAILKSHLFDVDTRSHMGAIGVCNEHDMTITAITPALDTLWVGLAGGCILVIRKELLAWFCPYKEYIRFLVCIPGDGPCGTEKAMVVSGAKGLRSPIIPGLPDYDSLDENGVPVDRAGTLIIWEAFPSKMCRQISMIQSQSSTYLESHQTVRQVIEIGEFKDGTYLSDTYTSASTNKHGLAGESENETLPTPGFPNVNRAASFGRHAHHNNMETLDILLPPDGSRYVAVSCPKLL